MTAAQDTASHPWTTRRLLAWIGDAFTKQGIDSPRLCAEILVAHVLQCERLKLYLEQDRPASPAERNQLRDLVGRGLKHEPIQYLVGNWPFFGLPLNVDHRALIPRPCTELIVERVLQEARARHRRDTPDATGTPSLDPDVTTPSQASAHETSTTNAPTATLPPRKRGPVVTGAGLRIADICTGSGCIALAIAKNLLASNIVATDVSSQALELARSNAERHKVTDRVEFRQGDLLEPLASSASSQRFDAIVSNPPYIPDREWQEVPSNVKDFEPHLALRGGEDGLQFVRPLIAHAPALLAPRGLLLIEIAASTAEGVLALAQAERTLNDAEILIDHEGHPRVLQAWRR